VLGAKITANRTDELTQRDFLNAQRTVVYGEFLAAVDRLQEALDILGPNGPDVAGKLELFLLSQSGASKDTQIDIGNQLDEMETLHGQLRVIGGRDVRDVASLIDSDIVAGYNTMRYIADCTSTQDTARAWLAADELVSHESDAGNFDNYGADMEAFIEAARSELGAD
jgi:hypothetical protein